MKLEYIGEYEALTFLMRTGIFDEFRKDISNCFHIGIFCDDTVCGIISFKEVSNNTCQLFSSISSNTSEIVRFLKNNWSVFWELIPYGKVITFIKDNNKKSLMLSSSLGFSRTCHIKNYEIIDGEKIGMVIKELDKE